MLPNVLVNKALYITDFDIFRSTNIKLDIQCFELYNCKVITVTTQLTVNDFIYISSVVC